MPDHRTGPEDLLTTRPSTTAWNVQPTDFRESKAGRTLADNHTGRVVVYLANAKRSARVGNRREPSL